MLTYQGPAEPSRKRSRADTMATYDYPGLQQLQAHASEHVPVELTPQGHHAQLQSGAFGYQYEMARPSIEQSQSTQSLQSLPMQHHHHHRLPNQPPPSKSQPMGAESSSAAQAHGPPSGAQGDQRPHLEADR